MSALALLCSDCTMWAANRDDSGATPEWVQRVDDGFTRAVVGLFIPIPGEADEGIHCFSRMPCDGCGDRLHGVRCEAISPGAQTIAAVMSGVLGAVVP